MSKWTSAPMTYSDEAACPACGSPPDYCQGHGSIGDPLGWAILSKHDQGDHSDCIAPWECAP